MIRDFWSIEKNTLHQEIDAIKDKVDKLTWDAIMAVKEIGNVGAHMRAPNDVLIDVDPKEATLLIGLIEMLVSEWYINRYEREERMRQLIDSAKSKEVPTHAASSGVKDLELRDQRRLSETSAGYTVEASAASIAFLWDNWDVLFKIGGGRIRAEQLSQDSWKGSGFWGSGEMVSNASIGHHQCR